jgi:hypothetical protein
MKAVDHFHALLSAGRFDEIFDDADPTFRSQSRQKLIGAMQETYAHYGSFEHVTFSQLNVIIGAPIQIRAVYNSTFARGRPLNCSHSSTARGKSGLLNTKSLPALSDPRHVNRTVAGKRRTFKYEPFEAISLKNPSRDFHRVSCRKDHFSLALQWARNVECL